MSLACLKNIAVSIGIVGVCLSCSEQELPDVQWEGNHIRFATSAKQLPCGKTLNALESAVEDIEEKLRVSLPESTSFTYYWLPVSMELSECPPTASGCSGGTIIFAVNPVHKHELVHGIWNEIYGMPHLFFAEGLAVAFGDNPVLPAFQVSFSEKVKQQLVPNLEKENVDYEIAGLFVSFLYQHYGVDVLKNIVRRTAINSDYETISEIVKDETGGEFNDILEQFRLISYQEYVCLSPSPYCKEPDHTLSDLESVQVKLSTNCQDDDFLGPFEVEPPNSISGFGGKISTLRSTVDVSIDKPGWYELKTQTEPGQIVELIFRNCGPLESCIANQAENHSFQRFFIHTDHNTQFKTDLYLPVGQYNIMVGIQPEERFTNNNGELNISIEWSKPRNQVHSLP